MKNINNAFFIQGINAFIGGSLEILLPLLLIEKNIRIEYIGLIFALGPLVFQTSRVIFAILSDFFGRKKFFILNSILTPISSLIYYISSSPLVYAFGKVLDDSSSALLWSVNRAFFLEQDEHKKKNLVHMRTVNSISTALGRFVIGFLIVYILFYNALLLLILMGILIIPFSLSIKEQKKRRFKISEIKKIINIKNKSKSFKKILFYFTFLGLSDGIIFGGYVIPVFLSSKSFSPEIIGLLLGLQLFVCGVSGYFMKKLKMKHLLFWGVTSFSIFTLSLIFLESYLLAIAVSILLGTALGLVYITHEFIFSHIVKKESYAVDVALLLIGFHLGRGISQAASGFMIPLYGYASVFLFSIVTFMIYSIGLYRIFKNI